MQLFIIRLTHIRILIPLNKIIKQLHKWLFTNSSLKIIYLWIKNMTDKRSIRGVRVNEGYNKWTLRASHLSSAIRSPTVRYYLVAGQHYIMIIWMWHRARRNVPTSQASRHACIAPLTRRQPSADCRQWLIHNNSKNNLETTKYDDPK